MGIRLYLTFYNCITASENAYATSLATPETNLFINPIIADSHLWSSSGQIISQNKVKKRVLYCEVKIQQ